MKTFLKKIFLFTAVLTLLFSGVFLPATPRIKHSLIFADAQKDALLRETASPRIIFIGGSNLSFGLNSQMIKDSTGFNPINTGIHAKLGLKYMLDNTLLHVRPGDTLILVPEYDYFFQPYDIFSKELSRIIFDVDFSKIRLLNKNQLSKLARRVPKYLLTKIKPKEYWGFDISKTYGRDSFNQYGDVDAHWEMQGRKPRLHTITGNYNPEIVARIKEFEKSVKTKGATLYLSFPGLHQQCVDAQADKIKKVESAFHENNLNVLGNALRYSMPTPMMFDSAYHLNKTGVDLRTRQFIEDFSNRKPSF